MRKVIFLCVLVAFMLAPLALAADKTVTFYGSVRVMTFIDNRDAEWMNGTNGLWSDTDTYWETEPWTTRFGADFAVGDVTGKVELRPGQMSLPLSTHAPYTTSGMVRHWVGTWKVGPGKLIVGQTWTPTFVGLMESNIASDYAAGGSNGADVAGSLRLPGLQYHMPVGAGTLKIALLKPSYYHASDANELILANGVAGYTQDDDTTLPRIEVSYDTKISMVQFGLIGGYNSSSVEMHGAVAGNPTYSYDIDSYILGGWFNIDFKPAYIKGSITMGQNWAQYGVANTFNDSAGATVYTPTATSAAIADADNISYGLVVGFVANDNFTMEGWYYHSESDLSYTNTVAAYDIENEGDCYGVIGIFKMAENVYIMPEIAFYDAGQTTTSTNGVANLIPVENGTQTLYGICWKINF